MDPRWLHDLRCWLIARGHWRLMKVCNPFWYVLLWRRVKRWFAPEIPPCKATPTEVDTFFHSLARMAPEQQIAAVRAKLREDPGIQHTKQFCDWGIGIAKHLK